MYRLHYPSIERKMNIPPARSGWLWIQQGFQTFTSRPFELLFMFFGLIFCNVGLSLIPVIGAALPFIIGPALGIGLMNACRDIDQGKPVSSGALFIAFRSPAVRTLLLMGALYMICIVAALASSILVDDGVLWKYMTEPVKLDQKELIKTNIGMGMLTFFSVFTPAAMAFWFGAPLIFWHGMSLTKAMFYSFFAVWRARKAFLMYLLTWCGILTVVSIITGLAGSAGGILLLPIMLSLMLVMYCSFYFSYKELFARDEIA